MDDLRLFCDVARLRSFSRAAELHDVTQSAVSQRIRGLEEELGVQLLDRSRRPPRLTAAGRLYYRGCRSILARYDALTRRLRGGEGPVRGEVVVAAIYSSDMAGLNRVRVAFQAAQPEAKVRISYLHPDEVVERVRRGECDVGIVSYPERLRDLVTIPLREEVMAVACDAEHPLATRRRVGPADLLGHPLVGFDARLPISREILGYLRVHGVHPEVVQAFDNVDTIKAALAGSDAVALLPARTTRAEVELGVLATIPLEPTLTRPVGLIHGRGQTPSPVALSFIEFLLKHERTGAGVALESAPAPNRV
jgi:DNA-binding transcriptional LysR family regulator